MACEQGREGWSGWLVGPSCSERERERGRAWARGPARGKEKWVWPKEILEFFICSNNFQMSLNCFDEKVDLPRSKNFKTKYVFEGNQIRNKFPYRNFSKFGVEFELKFRVFIRLEIQ
jgi:hypothetical protein